MARVFTVPPTVQKCTYPEICPTDSNCDDCTEIQELNRQISSLEERKSAAISRINSRRDRFTTRLPPEVVSHMFKQYVKLHPVNVSPRFHPLSTSIQRGVPNHFMSYYPKAPLRLGAVCRLWRDIAWAHPPLWDNLYINLSTSGFIHGLEIVKEWLARSRSLPLDIRVSDGDYRSSRSGGLEAIAVINMIKQFSSQWQSLDIQIQHSDIIHSLGDSYSSNDQNAPSTSLLRHLSLVGERYELPYEKLLRPSHWTRLSHLHITGIHVDRLRWILERICKSSSPFIHLSVERFWRNEGGFAEASGVLLPRSVTPLPTLLALSLGPLPAETLLSELLAHLDCPALQSLECALRGPTCVPNIMSFLSRSGCSLQEFIISGYDSEDVSIESVSSLLRALPALQGLTLSVGKTDATLFCELLSQHNFSKTDAPVLPDLRRLALNVHGFVEWPPIVALYIEDSSLVLHPKDRNQTQIPYSIPKPGRESLQLVVYQRARFSGDSLIDVTSLVAFSYLWKQQGVRIKAKEQAFQQGDGDLLIPSYRRSGYYNWHGQMEDEILTLLQQLGALAF